MSEIKIDTPSWEPPKIKHAEKTLDAYNSLINGVTGNTISENNIETAARLLISMMVSGENETVHDEIIQKFDEEYKNELSKITTDNVKERRESAARTRAWCNLVAKANVYFSKFIRSQGNEIKMAVVRKQMYSTEGDPIVFESALEGGQVFEWAKHIAETITGKRKADARILIVGQVGSGKSYFAMAIAWAISVELSKILTGDYEHCKDYFDPAQDIGVITAERLLSVMCRETPPYHIKVLDDIGMSDGFNSRKWQSDTNDATTSLFGVNRTQRGVLIVTCQSHTYVDKKLRENFNWYIDITGPMNENEGTNVGKLYKMTIHGRNKGSPVYFPFMRDIDTSDGHTMIYKYIDTGLPPKNYIELYDPIRDKVVAEINETKLRQVLDPKPQEPKTTTDADRIYDILSDNPSLRELSVSKIKKALDKEYGISCSHEWVRRQKNRVLEDTASA